MSCPVQFLDLQSGGRIAWEECGDPQGTPVFFFHGWPASRLQGEGFDVTARELGVRIISPDRPGIGLSTFQANRKLLDWPPVIAQIAQHLGIERFRVLAISGGGPYAFATAWALREQVKAACVISGAPPLPPELDHAALFAVYRLLLSVYRKQPGLLRLAFRCARPVVTRRPPQWLWPLMLKLTARSDTKVLRDPCIFEASYNCYRESWRGSALGVATDGEIYAEPWGFDVSEIQTPIRLWHGKEDRSFRWELAAELAGKLPHCNTHIVENEGHYSLPIRHRREILEDLLRFPSTAGALE
ncbi:MAG: alpha/beta hydrolase [Verrucomicrobiaceae bacterium]|nr:MAG: alpha/beta hydrolase [Verrucomicrobiaceae bacterium]